MKSGFLLYDDAGRKQVTDNATDLVYKKKIAVNDYLENDDLVVALQPAINGSSIFRLQSLPENLRNRIKGNGNLYIFNFEYVTPLEKFGLEVYDERGDIKFTSNLLSISIIDVVRIEDIRRTRKVLDGRICYFSKNYSSNDIAVIPLHSPAWAGNSKQLTESYYIKNGCLRVGGDVELNDPYAARYLIPSYTLQFLVIDTSIYK